MPEIPCFPFSALVGQEPMKRALLVSAIYPRVGGVLIVGQRGSAKSTAARALANLLPRVKVPRGCPVVCDPEVPESWCESCLARGPARPVETEERPTPFVALPVGATQDRVVGTLDLERAVTEGKKRWEPGLLARAHRGILYIDEVNLLPDHLVDLLLDVAASGVNTVEREGISLSHPARFILIGTMNPDEGELRPQLLDRFGLCVEAESILDMDLRAEIVARTLAFESDPETFCAQWAEAERSLRQRLLAARERVGRVRLPAGFAHRIAELCCKQHVEGLRADIVIQKTCLALAAWDGRDWVNDADLEEAARLALPHRRKPSPEPPPVSRPPSRSPRSAKEAGEGPRASADAGGAGMDRPPSGDGRQEHQPSRDARAVAFPQFSRRVKSRSVQPGCHREHRATTSMHGPIIGFDLPRQHPVGALALAATLRAAAARQVVEGGPHRSGRRLAVSPQDFREPVHQHLVERLYVFVLDVSGSMAARRRMEITKSLMIGLLETTYRKRDRVALLTFGGARSRLVLPPTRSIRRAQRLLNELPVGGLTPMAEALRQARRLAERARRKQWELAVVLVSDGRSNVALEGNDPMQAVTHELAALARANCPVILLDAEEGPVRLGLMASWARQFGFVCVRLAELHEPVGAARIRPDLFRTA